MNIMTRALSIATVSTLIGGVGLGVQAQPAGPGAGTPPPAGMQAPNAQAPNAQAPTAQAPGAGPMGHGRAMRGPGMGDPAERLKALRTEIGITPTQAPAWDAYVKVLQDTAAQMRASRGDVGRTAFLEMSTTDRLALLTKRRDQREQAHAAVKAAGDALLPVLNDTQKVRALMSLPGLASPGAMMARHHAMHGMRGGPTPN